MILNIVASVGLLILMLVTEAHKTIDPLFEAPLWQHIVFNWLPYVVIGIAIWK